MRLGLFGCTADPFTVAHMAIVDKAIDSGIVDFVFITPTVVSYHRKGKKPWLSHDDRIRVIEAFVDKSHNRKRMSVCRHEFGFAEENPCQVDSRRFIDTLSDFRNGAVEGIDEACGITDGERKEFYVIIGTDSIANFHTWHRHDEILLGCRIIGVRGRNGLSSVIPNESIVSEWIEIDSKYESTSATSVREKYSSSENGLEEYLREIGAEHE